MEISTKELVDKLLARNGAWFATFLAETKPDTVANTPYQNLVKYSRVNGVIGNWNYERSVNRQRDRENKEADFIPLERKWGNRVNGTPFVEHKGKLYVEVKVEKVYETIYKDDGREIPPEVVRQYLRKKSATSRQNVDREIVLRDYLVNNIREITLSESQCEKGTHYTIHNG